MTEAKKKFGLGKGCLIVVGALFGLSVIGAVFGDGKGSKPASMPSASASAFEAATEWPKAGSASAEIEQKVITFATAIGQALGPCDRRAKDLREVTTKLQSGASDIYEGFSAAKSVEETCRSSWSEIDDIEIPENIPEKAHEAAEQSVKMCANAALSKQMMATAMTEIFDGNAKPSKVQEMKDSADASAAAMLACAAGVMMLGGASGVEMEKMSKVF